MHDVDPRDADAQTASGLPLFVLLLALVGCARVTDDGRGTVGIAPPTSSPSVDVPAVSAPGRPDAATPSASTPPPATSRPTRDVAATGADAVVVDAKSPSAAADAVARYFDHLAAGDDAEADTYWRDPEQAADFRRRYAALGRPAVSIDAPAGAEGAAGSIYVTVPVRFSPTSVPANSRERHGEVVMRRANDVPGATAEQRRWRIERIDVAMTPK